MIVTDANRHWFSHPGRAGKKPKAQTLVKRALANLDRSLPQIFEALIKKALEGDRDAQIYLIDRSLGKPKQQTEVGLTGGEMIGVGIIVELYTLLAEKQRELREASMPQLLPPGNGKTEPKST